MTAQSTLILVLAYFCLLMLISFLTGKRSDNRTFFTANKDSKWYVVAFGMIGASLSGVTFISVPGWVGTSQFSYMQMVLGYVLGYFIIIKVLLPIYYRFNVVSIYSYLNDRLGFWAYKTGALFFLISRVIGASFRLFLVAGVFQVSISDHYGIPYWATVLIAICLIWIYTFRSGIKTIVWTDTLQTLFMLLSVGITVWLIKDEFNWTLGEMIGKVAESEYSDIFFWNWREKTFFPNQFLSGALIALVMTGMDQDMMQKNLTCRSLRESQKNMWGLSLSLVVVNLLFLGLGALLFMFAEANQLSSGGDALFTTIALKHLSPVVGVFFVLGVIAAAYSSADSALTSLTTSFCIDFLGMDKKERTKTIRMLVHIGFSTVLFTCIIIFNEIGDNSVISSLFKAAGYTYGPLLGMFAFGILTKLQIRDNLGVLAAALLCPAASYGINAYLLSVNIDLGFLILLLNGLLMFGSLFLLTRKS